MYILCCEIRIHFSFSKFLISFTIFFISIQCNVMINLVVGGMFLLFTSNLQHEKGLVFFSLFLSLLALELILFVLVLDNCWFITFIFCVVPKKYLLMYYWGCRLWKFPLSRRISRSTRSMIKRGIPGFMVVLTYWQCDKWL